MTELKPRRKARSVAVQALFQLDLNPRENLGEIESFISDEMSLNPAAPFASELVYGVVKHWTSLGELIEQVADNWTLDRMAVADRNILRLGAFEIVYLGTPGPVAIDEMVEIARMFGSKDSARFVNGVLDRLFSHHSDTSETSQAE